MTAKNKRKSKSKVIQEPQEILPMCKAAKLLGIPQYEFMQKLVITGIIPVVVLHESQKRFRFWRRDLMEFIENNRRVIDPQLWK